MIRKIAIGLTAAVIVTGASTLNASAIQVASAAGLEAAILSALAVAVLLGLGSAASVGRTLVTLVGARLCWPWPFHGRPLLRVPRPWIWPRPCLPSAVHGLVHAHRSSMDSITITLRLSQPPLTRTRIALVTLRFGLPGAGTGGGRAKKREAANLASRAPGARLRITKAGFGCLTPRSCRFGRRQQQQTLDG